MSVLQLDSLSVRFGGHLAVSEVSLTVEGGRITGLIGPNGAGKTTTFNAICGVVSPSAGTVRFDGKDISKIGTHKRARLGIGRTFQRLEVFSSLTVRENIQVGLEIRQSWSRRSGGLPQFLADGAELSPAAEIDLLLERLELGSLADRPVSSLPTGHARLVELGRALAARPSVLLLDEPASGLDDSETEVFGDLLVTLASNGLGILLVEHDVALVMRVCEQLAVLDFGQVIATGPPEEIRSNEAVLAAYLGTEPTHSMAVTDQNGMR
ncbi:MAG TPA: ABC transporter ATP-binding protein [Microthrixaceae bacterium]|nr:ABC transporter ATP-binding protein [Microthrixaceae bacterium]